MNWLFDPAGLSPHGFCLLWDPWLIWTYAASDVGIALAYFTIPVALGTLARRRGDLMFRPVFWLFAAFILLCGTVHLLDVATLWIPAYSLEALIKVATAVVSIATAIAVWKLLPNALAAPSTAQLTATYAALQESETRYRTSFEQSPVPMHILDIDGYIISVSRSWLAWLGYPAEAVIGRHISDFRAPESGFWLQTDMNRLEQDGEALNMERRFRHADGRIITALVSARLEPRPEGALIVCVVKDETERRRVEEALRASEERLHQSQKMEAIGQLTGGLAHDFNNMLQSVTAALDLIERAIARGQTERVTQFIGASRESVERAGGLTHRLLSFARRQALQPRVVEPDRLVLDMEDLLRRTLGPEIDLVINLHDGVWSILCDPSQLESAVLNLAINARDAMPDGGRLTIASADRTLTADDLVDQHDVAPGRYVEIAVQDTGIGMAQEVVSRAFEPFFTTKAPNQGSGLGLPQIVGFVHQSGGFVRLQSAPREGTTMRLYLPTYRLTSMNTKPQPVVPDPVWVNYAVKAGSKTVLLVEDEPGLRAMMVDILRDLGCEVLEAADGSAGLNLIRSSGGVDVLVTDVGLPGMSGRQLAEAARDIQPGLPVLYITGYAAKVLDDLEISANTAVLRKPFTLPTLAAQVGAFLRQSDPVVWGDAIQ